jgi:hypothetical protein
MSTLYGSLEPDAGKLARPVLRGGGGSNATSLPDWEHTRQHGAFPMQHLVPQGKTVEDVINA